MFWNDDLHLSKTGYQKFATLLFNFILSCHTSKSASFYLRKIEKSFSPLSKTNIHISTKKNIHLFQKHKFCKPKYIHKSFVQCLHVREVSSCVANSSIFISANNSKPILVTAFTISVVSNVTMQSVNVTSRPICRFVCRNQRRVFFYQLSTFFTSCYVVQLMHVN